MPLQQVDASFKTGRYTANPSSSTPSPPCREPFQTFPLLSCSHPIQYQKPVATAPPMHHQKPHTGMYTSIKKHMHTNTAPPPSH
jgi:hypothetical protein